MDAAFEVMISAVNKQLEVLKDGGFKIYDVDNPSFYIKAIGYDPEMDKLLVDFREDDKCGSE